MRNLLASIVIATLLSSAEPRLYGQSSDPASQVSSGRSRAMARTQIANLVHYEATGLSLLKTYQRGRVPVVLVHGLWSGPWSWAPMVDALEASPDLRDHFQFWTFGYSTGDPIVYSAWLLRRDLDEARQRFDPDQTDPAFDRMVVVGHSMGGLLAKMMVQDSGPRLWQLVSDRKFDDLAGDPNDRDLFRHALFFRPRPDVRRVVFIATPHRGSHVDNDRLARLGSRLVRIQEPLRAAYGRLIDRNGPTFFTERLRAGLPTSIDELEWGSPMLTGLSELGLAPAVAAHSIIADRREQPRAGGDDGLVTYESAHLDGVASELLVSSGHLCQAHSGVIAEVGRILIAHLAR